MIRKQNRDRAMDPTDEAVAAVFAEGHRALLRFMTERLGERGADALRGLFREIVRNAEQERQTDGVRLWLGRLLEISLIEHAWHVSGGQQIDGLGLHGRRMRPGEDADSTACVLLYMLLTTLKPEYAEILWRVDMVDQPRERAARLLGTTTNNVGVRLFRARGVLRRRLVQVGLTCPIHGVLHCGCGYAAATRATLAEGNGESHDSEPGPEPEAALQPVGEVGDLYRFPAEPTKSC